MASVYIPTPFRSFTGNRTNVEVEGADISELLSNLDARFPGFRNLCSDANGEIPAHINIYVNSKEISTLDGAKTKLTNADQVAVIPALAGGADEPAADPSRYALTPERVERYSRHIIMPQVGSVGQRKLFDAKVLIVGAGGLGSPIALYLALAGVGTIGIVDFDVVDLSNLQRQILHQTDDIGKPKVQSARETINAHNPDVKVVTHEVPLHSENAMEIISQYDIIVNGADNFAVRYLVNDACVFLKKPLVDGSILLFDGQATVYLPGKGCYRCLYPTPPPPGLVPSCAEAGVLGALCATIGSIQATEVLKLVLEVGESLNGRLLLYDALAMEMRQVRIRRDPNCVVCGDHPTITELIDYDEFCGTAPAWQEKRVSIEVKVTSVLQKVTGAKSVQGEGKTVAELLEDMNSRYPGFREQITTADGSLHRFVNIYINDEDIRFLQSLETPVKEGDVLSILPALAGGAEQADVQAGRRAESEEHHTLPEGR